ncbi:MAG: 50S ribosomal protein L9 [Lentisphaerae bacterium GWF2_52_8]|nr:MAG: 50S ribosomal protein L9 [Lentisphaerae bacterium GWF2_52_8]
MKLILLQDVENLGLAGEEVSVSPGYARNYLLPRKLASKASSGTLRVLAARKEKIEEQRKNELKSANELSAKISTMVINIPMQASDDGHLFGSVSERVIAERLAELGVTLEHHRIRLPKQIRQIGDFDVTIKLHAQVDTSAKVSVVRA